MPSPLPQSWPASVTPRSWKPMLACGVWYAALLGFRFLPGMERHNGVFIAVSAVSAFATMGVMMALGASRKGGSTYTDRLALGEQTVARSDVRPELAIWKQQHLWTTQGAALRFEGASGSLVVGGVNHLLPEASERAVVTRVDASLTGEDFASFLRALGMTDAFIAAPDTAGTSVDLQESPASFRRAKNQMAPWFVTMAVAGVVGVIGGNCEAAQHGPGQVVLMVVTVAIVLGGVVVTFIHNARAPRVRYRLLVGRGVMPMVDVRRGAALPETAGSLPRGEPLIYRYSVRGASYEFPAVRLSWPSGKSIVVGVWDPSIAWPREAPRTRKLDHVIGPAEWPIVIHAVGLGETAT